MSGINRLTGRPITGWEEVVQSIHTILSTSLERRVERRWVGSRLPKLLGENLTPNNILRIYQAIVEGVELFEPRFKIMQIVPTNEIDLMRQGRLSLTIKGTYRPFAHLGDFTPDSLLPRREVLVYESTNGLLVSNEI